MDLLPLVLFFLVSNAFCTHDEKPTVEKQTTKAPCLGLNHTIQTVQDFTTDIVHNEFIVKFTGFYDNDVRRNYIGAALSGEQCACSYCTYALAAGSSADHHYPTYSSSVGLDHGSYEVLERHNPMAKYPSDFDVLVVDDSFSQKASSLNV